MSRIDHLVKAAQAAKSHALVKLGDRDALKVVSDAGSQVSFLTREEVALFQAAIGAEPEVWNIEGLPPCTPDAIHDWAEGHDHHALLTIRIHGARERLTASVSSTIAVTYGDLVLRRDELTARVAASLTDLYNGTWREGPRLSTGEIAKRLRLTNVDFSIEEGDPARTTLWFDDGGLFGGHSIEATLDGDGAIADWTLAG